MSCPKSCGKLCLKLELFVFKHLWCFLNAWNYCGKTFDIISLLLWFLTAWSYYEVQINCKKLSTDSQKVLKAPTIGLTNCMRPSKYKHIINNKEARDTRYYCHTNSIGYMDYLKHESKLKGLCSQCYFASSRFLVIPIHDQVALQYNSKY